MRVRAALVGIMALALGARAVAQPLDDAQPDDDLPTVIDDLDAAVDDAAPDPLAAAIDAGAADPIDPSDAGAPDPVDAGTAIVDAAPPVDALPSPDVDPLLFGQPEVAAVASPTEVRLGQPITLSVTAVYASGVAVNLPDPLVLGDGFEAGRREVVEKVRSDGRRIKEWQIRVYPWRSATSWCRRSRSRSPPAARQRRSRPARCRSGWSACSAMSTIPSCCAR